MKILFLNPPFKGRFSRTSRSPGISKGGTLYYPIWLAYCTGLLEAEGHKTKLIDAPAEGLNTSSLFLLLHDYHPGLVIIDTSTPSIFSDILIADTFKKKFPEIFIILVGTHPSALPEETLKSSDQVDAVAIGEYDQTILDLANSLENNSSLDKVSGIVFRSKNEIIWNDKRKKINDLDRLPFVSSVYKEHLNYKNYFFAAANYPMVMIMTGRGCPYKCFFCVYPQVFHGNRYRVRSPENIVDEFEYVTKSFPKVREIGIEDDCFTVFPERTEKICELILKRNIKITWYCNARGNLDYPLLKLMKLAGCRLVTVGFESGCQDILDNMHKGEKVERYYEFAKSAHRVGILVHGCIMIGNPGDNINTLKQSYEFAKKINCDSMQFYPLYVYPGTKAYAWASENNYLKTDNFSKWVAEDGSHNCVIDTPDLSSEEMVFWCDYYLKKYHLRPQYLARKLWQAISYPSEGYRSLKSALIFFSKIDFQLKT